MAKRLLEDAYQFVPDRTKIEEKQISPGRFVKVIPGRFSICDEKNGNNRIYPRKVWELNLAETSLLMQRVKHNAAFGLLEHPGENEKVDLRAPIAVMVTEVKFHEKNCSELWGNLLVLNTLEGQKLSALIEAGYNPYVSSRGYGTLNRRTDGLDEVQEDYVCEGWDVVFDPSFSNAELFPNRSVNVATETKVTPAAVIPEVAPAVKVAESISAPKTGANKTTNKTTMKDIKDSVQRLRSIDPTKISTAEFVRGMSEMQDLHRQASQYLVENSGSSWDVGQLHDEIKQIEQSWDAANKAPVASVAKLQEQNKNLIALVEKLTNAAITYRDELGSSTMRANKRGKVCEALSNAGRKLREKFDNAVRENRLLTKKYSFATECLDYGAVKYQTDVVKLGRAYLEEKFAEELKSRPALSKRLGEAKKPADIASIREALTEPAKVDDKGQKISETKVTKDSKKEAVTETKVSATRPTSGQIIVEGKNGNKEESFAATAIYATNTPDTIAEMVGVTRRTGQKSIYS